MAAKSKRALSDEEAAKLSSEDFVRYTSGEWHPDDDMPPASAAPETGESAIKKRKRALQEVTRATR
jgi:hypothetical protein